MNVIELVMIVDNDGVIVVVLVLWFKDLEVKDVFDEAFETVKDRRRRRFVVDLFKCVFVCLELGKMFMGSDVCVFCLFVCEVVVFVCVVVEFRDSGLERVVVVVVVARRLLIEVVIFE